ncbi:hypothetical protein A2U01_0065156, partial [Trifolium medium]|nr:hypothetical protein [Trifolium medium]
TTPPSGGLIAAQRWFAAHSPLLIIRYDQVTMIHEVTNN